MAHLGRLGDRYTKKRFSSFLFLQSYFNKKYVEVALNDFTMRLINSKWSGLRKCRRKRKTIRQRGKKT